MIYSGKITADKHTNILDLHFLYRWDWDILPGKKKKLFKACYTALVSVFWGTNKSNVIAPDQIFAMENSYF